MTTFYWAYPTAHSDCGYIATLPKEQYHNEDYKITIQYFQKRSDEIRIKDFHFDKLPCDTAWTPFASIVSGKFKSMADGFGISASYHSVNIIVSGELVNPNYYFVEPETVEDLINLDSPRTIVRPDNDELGFSNWININRFGTALYVDTIHEKHWVTPSKTFGNPWVISEAFKNEIEKYSLTNFNFLEVIPANKK